MRSNIGLVVKKDILMRLYDLLCILQVEAFLKTDLLFLSNIDHLYQKEVF